MVVIDGPGLQPFLESGHLGPGLPQLGLPGLEVASHPLHLGLVAALLLLQHRELDLINLQLSEIRSITI